MKAEVEKNKAAIPAEKAKSEAKLTIKTAVKAGPGITPQRP